MDSMQYPVVLIETEEGFAVSCPALPGCHSQGATREDALAAIRDAISLWQEVAQEDAQRELAAEGAHYTRALVTV
jgi:predicted RNase H-like HicB family nuclease